MFVCVSACLCEQVLLRVSVHLAITLYTVISVIAGIMCLLLQIETKGREMTVSFINLLLSVTVLLTLVFRAAIL